MLKKSVAEKCWRRVLENRVAEKRCKEVLEKGANVREVLKRSVEERCSFV